MRTPTPSELLEVWERGSAGPPAARALALLALAAPELDDGAMRACTIGQRDALLLNLRERLFGATLAGVADCPACGATIETQWDAAHMRAAAPPAAPLMLEAGAVRIAYRLPNAGDLLDLPPGRDSAASREALLARCIVAASVAGVACAPRDLPAWAGAQLEDAMAAADPMADVSVALDCPACGHGWRLGVDIASFLWTEIHAWAQRVLGDVHQLARAYGWSEAAILGLSAGRRQLYVAMSAP